jgi:hypothetical protein
MGAFVDFGVRQQACLRVHMTILGNEENALLRCAQGIVRAQRHSGGCLANGSGPDTPRARRGNAAQGLSRATPTVNARQTGLEQLQQQLPTRIDRCHGVTGAGAASAAYDLERPVLTASPRLGRIGAFELQFLKILRRYVTGHILP